MHPPLNPYNIQTIVRGISNSGHFFARFCEFRVSDVARLRRRPAIPRTLGSTSPGAVIASWSSDIEASVIESERSSDRITQVAACVMVTSACLAVQPPWIGLDGSSVAVEREETVRFSLPGPGKQVIQGHTYGA